MNGGSAGAALLGLQRPDQRRMQGLNDQCSLEQEALVGACRGTAVAGSRPSRLFPGYAEGSGNIFPHGQLR